MTTESEVMQRARLAASQSGCLLLRNNCGALPAPDGRVVRFGLANESKAMSARLKSADLIGIKPITITPDMVGRTVGVFWSVECKAPGWVDRGTERDRAQAAWRELVRGYGGIAEVVT